MIKADKWGELALADEPMYQGEPILAVAAVDELTCAEAIEKIEIDMEPLPFATDPLESLRPGQLECARGRQCVGEAGVGPRAADS